MSSKVSFTVRRPSPLSRSTSSGLESDVGKLPRRLTETPALGSPLAREEERQPDYGDSSDEDGTQDELVTGFDRFGVQRCVHLNLKGLRLYQLTLVPTIHSANGVKKNVDAPLVIPALKNRDWREQARKRRSANQFVPSSGATKTGIDGSVGGLGTRDSINSGPVLSGLQVRKQADNTSEEIRDTTEDVEMIAQEEETDDQKAIRAILAESRGEAQYDGGPVIDIIPASATEADALKQDVEELPESASLEDYARVPVSQFGAALLRGMGWKEGTAASRKSGKGLVEPYIPTARPALLGIGAKEQEVFDDGSKKFKSKRPDKRYVPVVRQERSGASTPDGGYSSREKRERSMSPRRSAAPSRRSSRSPDRYNRNGDGRRYEDRERRSESRRDDRDRHRDDNRDRERDRHRDEKPRRRDDEGGRERDRYRGEKDKYERRRA